MPIYLCEVTDPTGEVGTFSLAVAADTPVDAAELVGGKLFADGAMPDDGDVYALAVAELAGGAGVLGEAGRGVFTATNRGGRLWVGPAGRPREPTDLSRDELVELVRSVLAELYHDGPDTEWDGETVAGVADVLRGYGLAPGEPPANDGFDRDLLFATAADLRTALAGLPDAAMVFCREAGKAPWAGRYVRITGLGQGTLLGEGGEWLKTLDIFVEVQE